VIVSKTGELPPRVHNLLRLTEVAEIELNHERGRFTAQLSGCSIQSRYLFGSHVDGTADQWSDIDVAVFMEGVEH